MNIIDIKRRIMFISAAVKYLSIIARNNHLKTDEEIKSLLAGALPIILDQDIKNEEKAKIENLIFGVLIKNKEEIVKTSNEFSIITKPISFIDIHQLINISDFNLTSEATSRVIKHIETLLDESIVDINVGIVQSMKHFNTLKVVSLQDFETAKSFVMKYFGQLYFQDKLIADVGNKLLFEVDEKIRFANQTDLLSAYHNLLGIDSKFKIKNEGMIDGVGTIKLKIKSHFKTDSFLSFEGFQRVIIEIEDYFKTQNEFSVSFAESNNIQIEEVNKVKGKLDIELSTIIPIHFTIDSKFNLNNKVRLSKDLSKSIKIENDIYFEDFQIYNISNSEPMVINDNIEASNNFIVSLYKHAIINDYIDEQIGSFKNKDIFDFIYILI